MQVHTYCVEHDLGFAPNPFHGVCSLACCAPHIRKYGKLGDIVVGRSSARVGRPNHLIYWMRIEEIIRFDEYDTDQRFIDKKPLMTGSSIQRYGDNIYFRDPLTGAFAQRNSFHSEENGRQSASDTKTDTGTTDKLLLGRTFTYFGGSGPEIPQHLRSMFTRRNRKSWHPADQQEAMLAWLAIGDPKGVIGLPTDWAYIDH